MKNPLIGILLPSLLLALPGLAFAEELPKGLGLHLGLNFANVSMDSTLPTSSTIGYVVGGTYDYGFDSDLSFMPGLQIAQRGFGFDVGTTPVDLKVTYLEVPLLFQARFRGASVIPFFIGGPVAGLKLSTGCSVNGGDCTIYDDHQVKSLHMGLELGAGAIFPLETGAGLSAQFRYHLGLTRVAGGLPDPRHRGVLLEVGYLF